MRRLSTAEYDEELARRLAALLLAEWHRVQRVVAQNDVSPGGGLYSDDDTRTPPAA